MSQHKTLISIRPVFGGAYSRSRGLQWFFSFFLVFLVESSDQHNGCILLLDEPGVTLHPIAQEDLIQFFKSISHENQVLYTTHSPFLIDSNNLSNVKAVYVDEGGYSAVSSDLRKGSKVADNSIYPVHAAIGLSVSETFLHGCQPVLVEGVSDQIYLHAIKNYWQRKSLLSLSRELIFIPTGGVKGMKPIINIISSKNNIIFPTVILDCDEAGKKMQDSLKKDLYAQQMDKLIDMDAFTTIRASEIEDLIPKDILADILDRQYRTDNGDYFAEEELVVINPVVPQIEAFYKLHNLNLENGWKVELAKETAKKFDRKNFAVDEIREKSWTALFNKIVEEHE